MRVVAIARFDSFTRMALILVKALWKQGCAARIATTQPEPASRSDSWLLEWTQISERTAIEDIVAATEAEQADVLILGLDGRTTTAALRALRTRLTDERREHRTGTRQPVVVSAYPGIILRERIHGLMARAPVDVLCLNSDADLRAYRDSVAALGGDAGNAIVTGPPSLWPLQVRPPVSVGPIVFFEQPNMPRSRAERAYVADSLLSLAARFPATEVLLKPRSAPGERTFHDCPHPIARLLRQRAPRAWPANLRVTYEPVAELLPRTRLALTFSSTVALEAMKMGVATRILGDLGLSEHLGTAFFARSGALSTFASIHPDMQPAVDAQWLRAVCGPDDRPDDGPERFVHAVHAALAERRARADWPLRSFSPFWGSTEWQACGTAGRQHVPPRPAGRGSIPKLAARVWSCLGRIPVRWLPHLIARPWTAAPATRNEPSSWSRP